MKLTRRLLCVLLAIVLLIGIAPASVFASGDEAASSAASSPGTEAEAPPSPETTPAETTSVETTPVETTSVETVPAETTPVETTPVETTPVETTPVETTPEATASADAPAQEGSASDHLTEAAYAASERASLTYTGTLGLFQRAKVDFNGITIGNDEKSNMLILGLRDMAVDWSNYQRYPYADAAGTPVYCIEPGVGIGFDGYESESVTIDDVWSSLSEYQRNTIGLILLYGAPNMPVAGSTERERFPNEIVNEFVTAVMIHEVIHGWRDVLPPYSHNSSSQYYESLLGDDTHNLIFTSDLTGLTASDGTSVSLWKKSISAAQVKEAYDYLETKLAQHNAFPSFTSDSIKKAPTHTMAKQTDGSYAITLTDTSAQEVVKNSLYSWEAVASSLSDKGGSLTVNQSAGQLAITAPCFSAIPTQLLTATRDDIPNPATSTYLVWNSKAAGGQTVMQLKDGKYDPVPAYFKLEGETVYLNITKTTSDGSNLAGWQFGVYEDAACTKLLVGPLTTDETGMILDTAIPVGTTYIKEIGHTDPAVNALYVCAADNPQAIDVTVGAVAEVQFSNVLCTGRIEIRKINHYSEPLAGAVFLLEWSADGDAWCPVTYSAAAEAGGCSSSGLENGCLTSGEDGLIVFEGLYPGLLYRLTETKAPNGYSLLKGTAYEGGLPADTLLVGLTVVNEPGFGFPATGSTTLSAMVHTGSLLSAAGIVMAFAIMLFAGPGAKTPKCNSSTVEGTKNLKRKEC